MGRFHRHDDGTEHDHEHHDHGSLSHEEMHARGIAHEHGPGHEHGDHDHVHGTPARGIDSATPLRSAQNDGGEVSHNRDHHGDYEHGIAHEHGSGHEHGDHDHVHGAPARGIDSATPLRSAQNDGGEASHNRDHHGDYGHGDRHDHDHEYEQSRPGSAAGDGGLHDPQVVADWVGDMTGYQTASERVDVLERIFDENDRAAAHNRRLFDDHQVTAVNVMSSPGSGKTTILAAVLQALQGKVRCAVIEGDIETALDADRLGGYGAQISLLNTGQGFGGECHLDAPMVAHALNDLDLAAVDLVLIENVGNLVCPAEFDVGAHRRVMVYSVTEGEDKPLKYPVMFRSVEAVLVNKTDLLPYLNFDLAEFERNLRLVNPDALVLHCSATTGQGMDQVVDWFRPGSDD